MPTYGHPDDTPSQVPYGQSLVDETGTVIAAGNTVSRGPFASSGYQSLVLTVNNAGLGTVTVTVTWDFRDSAGQSFSSRTFSVGASAARRVLYPNQGDRIISIDYTASVANVTLDLYVAGSNLPPFSGTGDWALMWADPALGDANQTIPSGAETALAMHHFKSAGPSFLIDTANSRIYPLEEGLYACTAVVHWPTGAGAFPHAARAVANPGTSAGSINEFMNPAGSDPAGTLGYFDDEAVNYILLESIVATTYLFPAAYQTSGVNQVLAQTRRFLVRRVGATTELTI